MRHPKEFNNADHYYLIHDLLHNNFMLDFLSERAARDIIGKITDAVVDSYTHYESVYWTTASEAIDNHGLASVLGGSWKSRVTGLVFDFYKDLEDKSEEKGNS